MMPAAIAPPSPAWAGAVTKANEIVVVMERMLNSFRKVAPFSKVAVPADDS
jgi:hypothetical protein